MATDDHQNRINELLYAPSGITGPGSAGAGSAAEIQAGYVKVPYCFSIVCGPLGATGPETVTDHSFANIKAIADSVAAAEAAAGIEPIGLAGYPGLQNVYREGDPDAATTPSAVDFYSPDTFNYNVLEVSPDGTTLSVSSIGILANPQNSALEYDPTGNPAHKIFSFDITAASAPKLTSCPLSITLGTDPGRCSTVRSFAAVAAGFPAPTLTFTLNGTTPINPPYDFAKGTSLVTCVASSTLGTDTCSFTVTVKDGEAPVASATKHRGDDDAIYTLHASDNCDGGNLVIFVKDSAEGPCGGAFVAGPYAPGTRVRFERNRQKASVRKGDDGAKATIKTRGNPLLVVTDAAGNVSCTPVVVRFD